MSWTCLWRPPGQPFSAPGSPVSLSLSLSFSLSVPVPVSEANREWNGLTRAGPVREREATAAALPRASREIIQRPVAAPLTSQGFVRYVPRRLRHQLCVPPLCNDRESSCLILMSWNWRGSSSWQSLHLCSSVCILHLFAWHTKRTLLWSYVCMPSVPEKSHTGGAVALGSQKMLYQKDGVFILLWSCRGACRSPSRSKVLTSEQLNKQQSWRGERKKEHGWF